MRYIVRQRKKEEYLHVDFCVQQFNTETLQISTIRNLSKKSAKST